MSYPSNNKSKQPVRENSSLSRLHEISNRPLRSKTFKQIVRAKFPNLYSSAGSIVSVKTAKGSSPNELAEWMRSLRKRADAALLQNDKFEAETEDEIAEMRAKLQDESEDEDDFSHSFNKLGEILERKRQHFSNVFPNKKQRVLCYILILQILLLTLINFL